MITQTCPYVLLSLGTQSASYPSYLFSLIAYSADPDYSEHLCYSAVLGPAPLITSGASEGLGTSFAAQQQRLGSLPDLSLCLCGFSVLD